jgi:hypoxanthine phosphoribosyltransferase
MHPMRDDLDEILLTEEQIQQRLDELAAEIRRDYDGKDLILIGVLTGTVLFMADLVRRLPIPLRLDYIGVSSYRGGTQTTRDLVVTKSLKLEVRDRHVLVVDDILDSGLTLGKVQEIVRQLQPRDLRLCVLLEKDIPHEDNVRADYVAFHIPNKFVVGYGLDYEERYRNLPFVATLKPSVIAASAR